MKVSFFYTMEDLKTGVKVLNEVVLWRRLMDVALSGIVLPLIEVCVAIKIGIEGHWPLAFFILFFAILTSLFSFLVLPKKMQRALSKRVEKNKNLIRELSIERFLTILDKEFQLTFESVNKVIKYSGIENVIIEKIKTSSEFS